MKKTKISLRLLRIFKLLILSVVLIVAPSFKNSNRTTQFDFCDFKNKSYYITLFTETEIIHLNEADEIYEKAKTYMIEADNNFRKSEGYQKMYESSQNDNTKKVERYEKKAIKIALKAYDNYFIAMEKKFRVYSEKLSNYKFDTGKRHLKAEEYAIDARSYFLNGTQIFQDAKTLKGSAKLQLYKNAYSEQIIAIEKQEIAFMILMNDPFIKDIDHIEESTGSDVADQDTTENDTYEPGKDPNIYVSKEDIITERLEFSDADLSLLIEVSEKIALADIKMKEVDEDYKKIDNMRKEAENTEDDYDRELKLKMASGLESMLFDKMIEAANLYYDADKTKYGIYMKYLPLAKNNKYVDHAKKYEDHASLLHANASKLYNKTNFYSDSKSNQYIQLMNAVQTELSAIQELENAFCIYFEQEPEPLEVITEPIVENVDDDSGKAVDINDKLAFNYLGAYSYSTSEPEPKKLMRKQGIIFKVQIGLFKELLPLKQFGMYSPISFDTFKNNSYKRFMLGEFRSNKSAELLLEKMKAKGFADAFIVAFENGERRTLTYGVTKIVRNPEFEKMEADEIAVINGNVIKNINPVDNNSKSMIEISKIDGLVYLIQLGNFSVIKSKEEFNGVNPIFSDYSENSFKYLTGSYRSYEEAKKHIPEMIEKGFKDVFVTSYLNGKRISLNQAIKNNQNMNVLNNSKNVIYYSVQIGLYSHKLSTEELKQYNEIEKKYPITSSDSGNGLYLYSAGKFNTYEDADTAKKYIKNLKLDGFIIAYKNGVKISASEAVNLQKNN